MDSLGHRMKHSIENTVRRLRELAAPRLLLKLAHGTRAPGLLEYEFQEPQEFYWLVTDYPGNMPFEDCLVPLWETNGDSITAFVDVETPMAIRYYYEDSDTEFEVVGHSIMEAIEHTLAWLLGECGHDPIEVLAVARACEHPSAEDFVRRMQAGP